ncbi:peptide receptor GPCR [Elysia marginata]|uniref:Peptide receptor GPCR n=1 Tax=Elysia marginata TaxID=1093978 RepID=A0AAV4EGJ3_9GAST|nr:peptide receptor GPCR [Elysia marginata]
MKVFNLSNNRSPHNTSSSVGILVVLSSSSTDRYDIPAWMYLLMMEWISYAMSCVSLFGITSNILIIVIYVKIGFGESINISYCALAVSDALYVTFVTWNAICFIPAFTRLDLPFVPSQVVIPTSGASTDIFGQITAWITAWISLERCLCVMFPLKVRSFITRKRTLLVIMAISLLIAVPLTSINVVFFVFKNTHDTRRNQTLLKMFRRNVTSIDEVNNVYFVYKTIISNLLPLLIVMACAVYLTKQLQNSAKWRHGNAALPYYENKKSINQGDKVKKRKYNKDVRIAKTVLSIAVVFIFLGSLGVMRLLVTTMWSQFRPLGPYGRWYRLIARLSLLFSQMNSSVNFIIYYNMGTKFRQAANYMFFTKKAKSMETSGHFSLMAAPSNKP